MRAPPHPHFQKTPIKWSIMQPRRLLMSRVAHDIAGKVFGNNKAIKIVGRDSKKSLLWLCECIKCGRKKKYRATDIVAGRASSCCCSNGRTAMFDEQERKSRKKSYSKKWWAKISNEKRSEYNRSSMQSYYKKGGYSSQVCLERQHIKDVSDRYVKNKLRTRYGLKSVEITDEMVDLKRSQIIMKRAINIISKEIKNGTDRN